MNINVIFLLYGFAGLLIHFLKNWLAAKNRDEVFFKDQTYIFYSINAIVTVVIVSLGNEVPAEFYVPSRFSSFLIGLSSSSILSSFMQIKSKTENAPEDTPLLKITKGAKTEKEIT
jgi:hypothetical protein